MSCAVFDGFARHGKTYSLSGFWVFLVEVEAAGAALDPSFDILNLNV